MLESLEGEVIVLGWVDKMGQKKRCQLRCKKTEGPECGQIVFVVGMVMTEKQ